MFKLEVELVEFQDLTRVKTFSISGPRWNFILYLVIMYFWFPSNSNDRGAFLCLLPNSLGPEEPS